MQPIDQTKFGAGKGNCWSACIASILEVPLDIVPNFCVDCGDDWWEQTQQWIEQNSQYSFIEMNITPAASLALFGSSYWIASGKSPRAGQRGTLQHAVVYCGAELAHDPHPDATGLNGSPTSAAFFTLARKE